MTSHHGAGDDRHHGRPRRSPRAAGATVVTALLLGLVALLPGTTAAADGPAPTLDAPKTYHVGPPDGRKRPDRDKRLHVRYGGDAGGPAGPRTGRLTMDVSGAEDVLRLKRFGSGCTADGALTVVCKVAKRYDSWTDWAGALPYAAPGSRPGDQGRLRMRYEAPDGRVATATTRVVVGGPILEVRRPELIGGVKPGAATELDLAVRNAGELPAEGVALRFTVDAELSATQRFANCRYTENGSQQTATCEFPDLRLEPGRTAVFEPALRMRAPEVLVNAGLHQSSWPLDLGPYHDVQGLGGGKPGDGPELRPVLRTSGGGSGSWSDEHTAWTEVRTDNPADYVAVGDRVRGAAGDRREVRVGARNEGPGDPGSGSSVALTFTPPEGAKVLKQPMEEIDEGTYEPLCRRKAGTYTCPLTVHRPGEEQRLTFTLELGAGGADGLVRLQDSGPTADRNDPDAENDTAPVTVEPSSASDAAPTAGDRPTARWATAAGLTLLAAAAAAFLLHRRRRTSTT